MQEKGVKTKRKKSYQKAAWQKQEVFERFVTACNKRRGATQCGQNSKS
jgi:hypothetical protein